MWKRAMRLWPHSHERARGGVATGKIEVGLLGATGMIGQQFVALLEHHPWFQLTWIGASDRSQGHRYGDLPWRLPGNVPANVADLRVEELRPASAPTLVLSALDAAVAGEVEAAFAAAGHYVVSNAGNFRMDALVPLLVPEVNAQHLDLLKEQQKRKKWSGAIVTNPNCAAIFLAMALGALREFQVQRAIVTTLQALSGAAYPEVASTDAVRNVSPWMEGEEDKIESETQKILGRLEGDSVAPHAVAISAQATRVPVFHGHAELVSVELGERVSRESIVEALREFTGVRQAFCLPSAPVRPIVVHQELDLPQPRFDVESGGGMLVHVGRLRRCPVLDYKFVVLGHNTIRGAAGAALLNAELLIAWSLFGPGQREP
jgi:aspartate-semialdehyde dehydrogenase